MVFKTSKVIVCCLPQVDGLRVKDLVSFCLNQDNGEEYLPSNFYKRPPNREWLGNICNKTI